MFFKIEGVSCFIAAVSNMVKLKILGFHGECWADASFSLQWLERCFQTTKLMAHHLFFLHLFLDHSNFQFE